MGHRAWCAVSHICQYLHIENQTALSTFEYVPVLNGVFVLLLGLKFLAQFPFAFDIQL